MLFSNPRMYFDHLMCPSIMICTEKHWQAIISRLAALATISQEVFHVLPPRHNFTESGTGEGAIRILANDTWHLLNPYSCPFWILVSSRCCSEHYTDMFNSPNSPMRSIILSDCQGLIVKSRTRIWTPFRMWTNVLKPLCYAHKRWKVLANPEREPRW